MATDTTPRPPVARDPWWRRPFRIVREHRRAYLVINLAAYGLVLIGFAIGLAFPELGVARASALEDDGTGPLVRELVTRPALFALAILAVNVVRLGLVTILLPSLVVPFAGLAFFAYWLVETGITLVPTSPAGWVALIPHALTLVIELQAYVLLALGAVVLGMHWLRPRTVGAANRRQSYRWGLQKVGLLALPALALLVVGAVWEAYSLRYLVHPLAQLLL